MSPRSPQRPQTYVEKPLSPGKEFTKHIEVRANGYCIYSNKRRFDLKFSVEALASLVSRGLGGGGLIY